MAHFPIVEQHGFAKDFLSCFGTVPRIFLSITALSFIFNKPKSLFNILLSYYYQT